jgi:putative transposase
VERNPLRANLVARAEDWRWSSLAQRVRGEGVTLLAEGPVPWPKNWVAYVNRAETSAELEALRRSVVRGAPFAEEGWRQRTAEHLGLQATLRKRGRPRKPLSPAP